MSLVGCFCFSVAAAPQADENGFPWDRIADVEADDFKAAFLVRVAEKLEQVNCYGRCTKSIAACLKKEPPHRTAARLARDVLLLMANEASDEEIEKWIEIRRKMAHPPAEEVRRIDLGGLTPLGEADAPVVIVEYSDFKCPFCAMVAPMLEKIARASDGKARLYFKQFPIKGHARALEAAQACVAADAFGKFWQYCPKLFANQDDLSEEKLLELAEQTGMERKAFAERMNSDAVMDRIAEEKMEGLRHRIRGTPTIFVNGKEFLAQPTPQLIIDRIEEEIDIQKGRD